VGGKLRAMMPWITKNRLVDQTRNWYINEVTKCIFRDLSPEEDEKFLSSADRRFPEKLPEFSKTAFGLKFHVFFVCEFMRLTVLDHNI
jgi:hypothetical protein